MDVYRQAAEVIAVVRAGNGTAKALCLRKEMQKKRQTYAVVCETLRHYELLEDVLAVAEFFKYYPHANKTFAICMAYDVVLGKGVSTKTDSTARAVQASASYLREAYWQVCKHHVIPPRADEKLEEVSEDAGAGSGRTRTPAALSLPRYARVNTLKIEKDALISRLRNAAQRHREDAEDAAPSASGRKRVREDAAEEGSPVKQSTQKARKGRGTGPRKRLPDFTEDPVVPSLLVFPHGTDLHAHPAVRSGQLVLQDRASCLPACILLDAVTVVLPFERDEEKTKPLEYVVDACAAPGNKTTQLAALGAPNIKLMAIERDERRAELLQRRVQALGAADYVNVVHTDFFLMSSDDRAATEGILLDPSCSASGVVTRVDVELMHQRSKALKREQSSSLSPSSSSSPGANPKSHRTSGEYDAEDDGSFETDEKGAINPTEQSNEFARNRERIEKLAALQRKLLAHALLSFDNCRTVVYSTCSVHEEENEAIVRTVLGDTRVQDRGWKLSNIMPGTWKTRGIKRPEDGASAPLDFTIRCDPATDATNGFYVARFDRELMKQ